MTKNTATSQISFPLTAAAVTSAGIGVLSGLVVYLDRSHVRAPQAPGTAAWPVQGIVAGVAVALYLLAVWVRARRGTGGRLLLLAPVGKSAATRTALTVREAMRGHGTWRALLALAPAAVIAYGFWRAGKQITAGLDPNFTVNAWGGPSYLGAMACHYLDLGLGMAACGWLLDKLLLRPSADRASTPWEAVRPRARAAQ